MNFSDAFKQTSQLCRFSPDGVYLVLCLYMHVVTVTALLVPLKNGPYKHRTGCTVHTDRTGQQYEASSRSTIH